VSTKYGDIPFTSGMILRWVLDTLCQSNLWHKKPPTTPQMS
jgi:hypothetical protein